MKIEGWANIYDEVNFTFNQSVFIYPTKELANLAHIKRLDESVHQRSGHKQQRITKEPFFISLEIPDKMLRINSQKPKQKKQEEENVCE